MSLTSSLSIVTFSTDRNSHPLHLFYHVMPLPRTIHYPQQPQLPSNRSCIPPPAFFCNPISAIIVHATFVNTQRPNPATPLLFIIYGQTQYECRRPQRLAGRAGTWVAPSRSCVSVREVSQGPREMQDLRPSYSRVATTSGLRRRGATSTGSSLSKPEPVGDVTNVRKLQEGK